MVCRIHARYVNIFSLIDSNRTRTTVIELFRDFSSVLPGKCRHNTVNLDCFYPNLLCISALAVSHLTLQSCCLSQGESNKWNVNKCINYRPNAVVQWNDKICKYLWKTGIRINLKHNLSSKCESKENASVAVELCYTVLASCHTSDRNWTTFLRVFSNMRKAANTAILSVRPSAWNNSTLNGQIFMKVYIWISFPKICREN
jgi:hypothetical protein